MAKGRWVRRWRAFANWGGLRSGGELEFAIGEDASAKSAVAAKGVFCAGAEGLIHPVTGAAFFAALEGDALEFEGFADERIEINAADDDVATEDGGGFVVDVELLAEALVGF